MQGVLSQFKIWGFLRIKENIEKTVKNFIQTHSRKLIGKNVKNMIQSDEKGFLLEFGRRIYISEDVAPKHWRATKKLRGE